MTVTILVAALLSATPEKDPAANESCRQTVSKALAFLDGRGAEIEKGAECINCHHAPLRFWALREAGRAGFPVDAKALQETTSVQLKKLLDLKDDYRGKQWGHSLSTFFLLGATEAEPLAVSKDVAANLREILVAEQAADGSWKAAQQFGNQRRPKKDANVAQTIWSLLALDRLDSHPDAQAARERALKWLSSAEPGATIDVRALRFIAERRWGVAEQADALEKQLIESQRDNGGWGWQPEDASDAWATSLALFALRFADSQGSVEAAQSARAFLIKTQQESGSWLVEGKLTKNSDMASYFGTTWAIIALSRMLPAQ